MIILSSPAKTLDLVSPFPEYSYDTPHFLKEATMIEAYLKTCTKKDLMRILDISEKLADVNSAYISNWQNIHSLKNSRPSIFTYKGDIFSQLDIKTYKEPEHLYAQKNLYVLSGLYGLVRAFDLMQAYRLEMRAPIHIGGYTNLYELWDHRLTDYLNNQIKCDHHTHLINVSSKEYAKPIDFSQIICPVIQVDFKEKRGDRYEIVGILAKKARGMMIDFCIKNKAENVADLTFFNYSNYRLLEKSDNLLVFGR
jgi:cytoplasmic iron level regulating protein YaaA (DUF328/UPF0246 family)